VATDSDCKPGGCPSCEPATVSRRGVLTGLGVFSMVAAFGAPVLLADDRLVIPNSEGFLVVDRKKCQGCGTCMMACSLGHAGVSSYSLARIQVLQDSFANWPDDVLIATCRQCKDAPCVEVCPTGANRPDRANGFVRRIDPETCIGCKLCIARCPYTPVRLQWDAKRRKSQKCDLCVDTPYLDEKGGPGGVQACVRACPVGAIAFTRTMPDQASADSYEVNLRGAVWKRLGITTED
jgi:protein NrfC